MAGSDWRWYSFIVQVLKQQQQKKKIEKKKTKKKRQKKKASLRMGQSVLWRLLTYAGALVVIFFVLCSLFPWGSSRPPSVGLLPTPTILPSWF